MIDSFCYGYIETLVVDKNVLSFIKKERQISTMSIIDRLKSIFKRSKALEINQSIDLNHQSSASNHQSIASDRFGPQDLSSESLEKPSEYKNFETNTSNGDKFISEAGSSELLDNISSRAEFPSSKDLSLERTSIELGLTAGYFGRSLKEIENTLKKIEDEMVSRDWFIYNLNEGFRKIAALIARHDESVNTKLSLIETLIKDLKNAAYSLPQPYRSEFISRIESVERKLPLTPRMKQVLKILQERGEISYSELSQMLGITESALRGLLSTMSKRLIDQKIERFTKNGKGWVRLKRSETKDTGNLTEHS